MKVDLSKLITAEDKAKAARDEGVSKKKAQAKAYLSSTDWVVIRSLEEGQPIPPAVKAARAKARIDAEG